MPSRAQKHLENCAINPVGLASCAEIGNLRFFDIGRNIDFNPIGKIWAFLSSGLVAPTCRRHGRCPVRRTGSAVADVRPRSAPGQTQASRTGPRTQDPVLAQAQDRPGRSPAEPLLCQTPDARSPRRLPLRERTLRLLVGTDTLAAA